MVTNVGMKDEKQNYEAKVVETGLRSRWGTSLFRDLLKSSKKFAWIA